MANQCTKLEVSSLSRLRDILRRLKFQNWPRPFQVQFVVRMMGLAMINLHTKIIWSL